MLARTAAICSLAGRMTNNLFQLDDRLGRQVATVAAVILGAAVFAKATGAQHTIAPHLCQSNFRMFFEPLHDV